MLLFLQILVHVSGIVLLTLIVNATTIKPLLQVLGMSEISDARRTSMSNAINRLNESQERSLSIMKTDRFMTDSDWASVERACRVDNPYDDLVDQVGPLLHDYHKSPFLFEKSYDYTSNLCIIIIL